MPPSKPYLINRSDNETYLQGERLFFRGLVKILSYSDGFLSTEIRDGILCSVTVELSDNRRKITHCSCVCHDLVNKLHICKHVIASILKLQSITSSNPALVVTRDSDNNSTLLMQAYIRTLTDKAGSSCNGNTILEPVLEFDHESSPYLFFRVGVQRMYIIQDLIAFKSNFRNNIVDSYGKLTLYHSIASFNESSKPLLEFFLRRYDNYNYIYSPSVNYRYYGSPNKKNMFLSPQMTDEFFDILANNSIQLSIRNDGKTITALSLRHSDFRPKIQLKKEHDGATLKILQHFALLYGDVSLYVLVLDSIYCCSENFSAACTELLKLLLKSNYKLFFANKDIKVLFSSILPNISPFIDLTIIGDFDEYEPLPLLVKIFLDSPDNRSISARMTFTYGDYTFDAFDEKDSATSHDIVGELVAENLLLSFFDDNPYSSSLSIVDDSDAIYRFITEGIPALSELAEIYTSDSFCNFKIRPPAVVSLGVRIHSGLLEMNFDLDGIDLDELPDILASYRVAKKYHRLRDGSFLTLEDTSLAGLSELAEGCDLSNKQLISGSALLPSSRALYLDAICRRNDELRIDRDSAFKRMLHDIHEIEYSEFSVPTSLRPVLRNYQKSGFRWLKTISAYGFGGILADDMGLGKTLQILTLLASSADEFPQHLPSIVICPSSLSLNWESETRKFTPNLNSLVISGSASERSDLISKIPEYDLVITSYDLLKRDIEQYDSLRFNYVIIDEAQYIKNHNTQNAKSVKALQGKTHFALTGTPVENSLAELWSIFDFLMPGYLFPYNRFRKKFEEPIVKDASKDSSERLKQLIKPFLLRRLKSDVLKELPPKTETILRSSMESAQKKVYLASFAQARSDILSGSAAGAGQERIMILAALTKMRQICCDPSLLFENYNGGSVKLAACMELIERCMLSGRRMLLFSQFTSMLDIIEKQLDSKNIEHFRIDGSTKPSSRLDLVNSFNAGSVPIFLISLKAGGTGLNLIGADVVVHYDPWWNLSAQNQATDRAHRIGQKNSVHVYKLIVKDTIEERILDMQDKKRDLANMVIEDTSDPLEHLNRDELFALFDMNI